MKGAIAYLLNLAANAFDKIPILNKFAGYRSAFGLVAMGVVKILALKGLLSPDLAGNINTGLEAFTALSLNAHINE